MRASLAAAIAAICFAATALPSRSARACSGPPECAPTTVFPVGESIPTNASGLESWPADSFGSFPPPESVFLERFDGTAWQPVPATVTGDATIAHYALVPAEPFAIGGRYRFTGASPCTFATTQPEFTVGAAAPLPTLLGTLRATEPASATIRGGTFVGGICAYPVEAMISDVTVDLSAAAQPWAGLLFYEARVDGSPWIGFPAYGPPGYARPKPGSTHRGRGTVRLSVACAPGHDGLPEPDGGYPFDRAGLMEGDHAVLFRARIVGTDTWIESDTVTVTLRCPPRPDAGTGSDASTDVGTMADSSADASGPSVNTVAGCGCRAGAPDARRSRAPDITLAVCALLALGRRKPTSG